MYQWHIRSAKPLLQIMFVKGKALKMKFVQPEMDSSFKLFGFQYVSVCVRACVCVCVEPCVKMLIPLSTLRHYFIFIFVFVLKHFSLIQARSKLQNQITLALLKRKRNKKQINVTNLNMSEIQYTPAFSCF